MTDGTRAGGDAGAGDNPWAPPGSRPSLDKTPPPAAAPYPPQDQVPGQAAAQPPYTPPSVHDQATMASMPAAPFAAPGYDTGGHPAPGAGSAVPPPPVAPTGPAAPSGYGYPAYPTYPGPAGYGGWPGMPMAPQNGMGTAAMVLGILSCCLFCLYGVVSLVLGVLAVVFGVKGRRRAERGEATNHGQAQAGLVMGIIGIFLGIAVVVLLAIGITTAIQHEEDSDPYYGSLGPSVTVLADR
ncbi:DUF4190 domain-containing protein [Streptomyces anandii]|uniref:DUF4190 domain-containing protein n=1 Tax=Streptomyces anandii TaxID=285454 RepID=UPI00167A9564|nr:DUF4190 domain-containing protein [Streptomyces anandii]GGY03960.1 hypothetical protein GCM10010510_57470 [Streptomyces anandii JCM 4720]